MRLRLRVNGEAHTLDAPATMPVLWVLRDLLGLTGTKFGCGAGHCGACTVHFNGTPVRSCLLPVSSVGTGEIRTIEGLGVAGEHDLQRLWKELDVPQCGYCQAGQLMSAAALLARDPRPTDEAIDAAMAGNLCRCGTYPRIREAIRQAAAAAETRR